MEESVELNSSSSVTISSTTGSSCVQEVSLNSMTYVDTKHVSSDPNFSSTTQVSSSTSRAKAKPATSMPRRIMPCIKPGRASGSNATANLSTVRPTRPSYYIHDYQATSSRFIHPTCFPHQQQFLIGQLSQNDLRKICPCQPMDANGIIGISCANAFPTFHTQVARKNVDKETQTIPESGKEEEQSLKSVVTKQRKLISQLVKIIVHDRLDKIEQNGRDILLARNNSGSLVSSPSCHSPSNLSSDNSCLTERILDKAETESSISKGHFSLPGERETTKMKDRTWESLGKERHSIASTPGLEMSEHERKTLEIPSPRHKEDALNGLRAEFEEKFDSLRKKFENCHATSSLIKTSIPEQTEDPSMNSSQVEEHSRVSFNVCHYQTTMPKLEPDTELSPFPCRSAHKSDRQNIIVIEDDFDASCLAGSGDLTCEIQKNDDNQELVEGADRIGSAQRFAPAKGKRRKNALDSLYTPTKRKSGEYLDGECRRSPRKKLKNTPISKYVRRSASKQATEKITSLLKESGSEFSPLSDSGDNYGEGKRKSRRNLLPPDLDATLEEIVNQRFSVVKSEPITEESKFPTAEEEGIVPVSPSFLGKNGCNDYFDGASCEEIPSVSKGLDNNLIHRIPRSIASTPLPNLPDPHLAVPAVAEPTTTACSERFRPSLVPINLLSHSPKPLDLSCHMSIAQVKKEDEELLPVDLSMPRFQRVDGNDSAEVASEKSEQTFHASSNRNGVLSGASSLNEFDLIPSGSQPKSEGGVRLTRISPILESTVAATKARQSGNEECLVVNLATANSASDSMGDLQIDERPNSDSCYSVGERKRFEKESREFDFTNNIQSEDGIKNWLSSRKVLPSSVFSIARGHGKGFLRPMQTQRIASEPNIGSTSKALGKVNKAKSIWRKIADCGKLDEIRATKAENRALQRKINKNRALLTLNSLQGLLSRDSSRGDDSSDGREMKAKSKKLKKRKERRRSSPLHKKHVDLNGQACVSPLKQEHTFPFVSQATESSENDFVPESSPTLYIWRDDDISDLARSRLSDSSQGSSLVMKIASSSMERSEILKSDCIPSEDKNFTEFERGNSRSLLSKRCSKFHQCHVENEKELIVLGNRGTVSDKDAGLHVVHDRGNQILKQQEVQDMSGGDAPQQDAQECGEYTKSRNNNDEGKHENSNESNGRNGSSLMGAHNLTSKCVVNISPLKYCRSGTRWLITKMEEKPRLPIKKTFVREKDCYTVRDTDEENSVKSLADSDSKNGDEESDSSVVTKRSEVNIAEWTMLPRRACSDAKEKISKLIKTQKKV